MQYAIIGAGNIGTAVAGHFARTGIEVGLAASRGVQALGDIASRTGPAVTPVEVDDALDADIVILAVPFEAVQELVGRIADWQGRIVVDATNAIDYTDFSPADLGGTASSDLVGEWAAGARVVKAFGHTWAKVLAREPGDGNGGKRALFVSGNHPDANATVAHLISQFGFEPIDLGRNAEGGLLQQFGGPLTTKSFVSQPIGGANPGEMDLVSA
ncbi:putative dinucleotide-binding enzyme [Mycolicibacterium aurum]|uniref:Putative dinucleotide-binding enzyme n=1 Tax=Mycolicibacterium aurum TaxID=1791 RepID=A0A3S4SMA6_MYCAU|nr:NADPH-dependent F420 reductase [Mycolicibacterium aurum]VEG56187.1 putative dinucleotide-binding enzyme [Mycolicibacterium aurum]